MKVFGSLAGASQLGKFGSLAAGSAATTTDVEEMQSLANYLTGWFGAVVGGNSPAIEDMNALCHVFAYQLAYIMQSGVPEWNTNTTYYQGSMVTDTAGSGLIYTSLVDDNLGNAVTNATKWVLFDSERTGVGKDYFGSTLPHGYVWASGKTIGNALSNGTERANADTVNLFNLLWSSYSDSVLPIYDSTGALSSRGASAAIDFAANKAIAVPDKRGRVSAGADNLGGTAASRLTSTTVSPNGTTIGASGGTQTHTLTTAEMPSHSHGVTDPGHKHSFYRYGGGGGSISIIQASGANLADSYAMDTSTSTTGVTVNNSGSGSAHTILQPTLVCNYIIKL